jgi:tol-pal system protein YbgF
MGQEPSRRLRRDQGGELVRLRPVVVLLAAAVAGGCALRSDVTKLRLQLDAQQQAAVRSDSVARANLSSIARLVQGVLDSLAAQQAAIAGMRGDLRVDLYNVQQQLVAVQELTGQSQQRLTELRAQLEQRSEQLAAQAPPPGGAGQAPANPTGAAPGTGATPGAPNAAPGNPAPDQLMELGLQQLRRGSPATARRAFAEFLKLYPSHPRAGDAWFFTGEAWTAEHGGDSAATAYRQVVQHYPVSGHVAAALYKLGMIAVAAGRHDEAKAQFGQLVGAFPLSDEAALAREQLRSLGAAPPAVAPPPR